MKLINKRLIKELSNYFSFSALIEEKFIKSISFPISHSFSVVKNISDKNIENLIFNLIFMSTYWPTYTSIQGTHTCKSPVFMISNTSTLNKKMYSIKYSLFICLTVAEWFMLVKGVSSCNHLNAQSIASRLSCIKVSQTIKSQLIYFLSYFLNKIYGLSMMI